MREYIEIVTTTSFPKKPVIFNVVFAIDTNNRSVRTTCTCNGDVMTTNSIDLIECCEWECLLTSIMGAVEDAIQQTNYEDKK